MENSRRAVRKPKFFPKRSKNSGLLKDKHAPDIFLKKISEFKRKRKYHRFISISPILLRGKTKQSFYNITDSLEEFRIQIGLGPNIFYKLVSEFILVPSGRKYYPLNLIFCDTDSQVTEEFIIRTIDTLTWISDLVGREYNNDKAVKEVLGFAKELSSRKISIDNVTFKSKDWYCVVAIKEMAKKKGWSEVELLERIRIFYKRKIKKVTVEMVLADLIHKELDKIDLEANHKKAKRKVKSYADVIKDDEWYEEWKEGIPG